MTDIKTDNGITASIVILTRNGGDLLQRLIKAIFNQKAEFSYEVVIVDSGSTDGTLELFEHYPVRLFKIDPKEFSFGPTRDFGFSQARGKCIVTISQDVVPKDENWLKNMVEPILSGGADVVQGEEHLPTDRDVFYWVKTGSIYFTSERNKFYNENGRMGLSCTNLAIRKDIWRKTKFGNVPMSEDQALLKKLYALGVKFVKQNTAIVYHGHDYDMASLIKRCENEGFGWRHMGESYTIRNILKDLLTKKYIYGELIRGILRGWITSPAELLFIFIRPICLYKGNHFNKSYRY